MSYISDFKTPPFSLFQGSTGGGSSSDQSNATLTGVKFTSADGRVFALVQNGGTALASGVLVQGPVAIGANHTGLAVAAAAATGATSISVTLGGTLVTANQYQGGFAIVSAGTGAGQILRIASHVSGTATANLTLQLEDPLSVNIDTSTSKVTLFLNQYGSSNGTNVSTHGVVISPSAAATGQPVGVTYCPIAASSSTVPAYGFITTYGVVPCLAAGSPTAGLDAMQGAVNGAVSAFAAGGRTRVGFFIVAGEDTKKQAIFVQL